MPSSFKSRFLANSRSRPISTPEKSSINFWLFGFLLIILILIAVVIGGLYRSNRNYERFSNQQTKTYTLQYYYMTNCGYCDKFKPEWNKITDAVSKNPNDYKFDVIDYEITSDTTGINMAKKYNVTGTPTILLVNNNNPDKFVTFNDERTFDKIINFANNNSN